MADLGYKSDGETVTLTMTRDDHLALILYLGFAAGGAAAQENTAFFYDALALVNRMNQGNPAWTPYTIPKHSAPAEPSKII